jgi:hypothetical protein
MLTRILFLSPNSCGKCCGIDFTSNQLSSFIEKYHDVLRWA